MDESKISTPHSGVSKNPRPFVATATNDLCSHWHQALFCTDPDIEALEQVLEEPVDIIVKDDTLGVQSVYTEVAQCKGVTCTTAVACGMRGAMEDRCATLVTPTGEVVTLVADGHGGQAVSQLLQETVPALMAELRAEGGVPAHYHAAWMAMDAQLRQFKHQGSTLCAVAFNPRTCTLQAVNVGDSMCLVWRNATGTLERLTADHNLSMDGERDRVLASGAEVGTGNFQGRVLTQLPPDTMVTHRTNCLNLTRAFGDSSDKAVSSLPPEAQAIIAAPDVISTKLAPGDVAFVACDGLVEGLRTKAAFLPGSPLTKGLAAAARVAAHDAAACARRLWEVVAGTLLHSTDNISITMLTPTVGAAAGTTSKEELAGVTGTVPPPTRVRAYLYGCMPMAWRLAGHSMGMFRKAVTDGASKLPGVEASPVQAGAAALAAAMFTRGRPHDTRRCGWVEVQATSAFLQRRNSSHKAMLPKEEVKAVNDAWFGHWQRLVALSKTPVVKNSTSDARTTRSAHENQRSLPITLALNRPSIRWCTTPLHTAARRACITQDWQHVRKLLEWLHANGVQPVNSVSVDKVELLKYVTAPSTPEDVQALAHKLRWRSPIL